MLTSNHRSDQDMDNKSFNLRLNAFFFSTFFIFCIIIIRLAVLQFVEGPKLAIKETNNRVKIIALPPVRGTIYDATHTAIAYSTPMQSLFITLKKDYSLNKDKAIKKDKARVRPEAFQLAGDMEKIFNDLGDPKAERLTKDNIVSAMDLESTKISGFAPRRIKAELSDEEVAYFSEHKADFPGIDIVEESVRHYHPDTIATQTVGYIKYFKSSEKAKDSDGSQKYSLIDALQRDPEAVNDPGLTYTEDEIVGFDGLEMTFQDDLRGKNGYNEVAINPQNMAIGVENVVPPEKGHDIYMTINKNVQLKTETAIMDQLRLLRSNSSKPQPNALTGYAVAMEVDTGNIIAMASMPDYDTNVWRSSGSKNISTEDWEKIQANYQNGTITPISSGKSGNGLDSMLLLGSTIKPLSVLIGLEENLFGINDYYSDQGVAYIGKEGHETAIRNSSGHVIGQIDPTRAIQESSNAFMVDMVGKRLNRKYPGEQGIGVWDKHMKKFGLGVSTGVDLPNEYLGRLGYKNIEQAGSYLAALSYASFGQQGQYMTIQLAQYTAMLANEGKRIKPQLVSEIKDQSGKTVKKFGPEILDEVQFDQSFWREVIQGMNTQNLAAFDGFPYDYARKTGTSQQDAKGTMRDNGIFIAFAPRDNPKLAIAVVIPEGGFGSQSAAPVARKIFDAYDEEYGLTGTPRKNIEAPDKVEQ
ncbi:cell division protein FtsI/penicillin-binding protein 2 [Paenibacillus sp. DS2015]|uniref:peptidoglycan D,D-transpeptidase FtsI family protein n=1 Tax=Paenibacillus sp. DS2015 TaxID=3373917 RepID=UPI003D1F9983